MRGVNRAILLGTMGGEPTIRTFQNGGKVASVSLATNEEWTDKNTGEKKQATEWHSLEFFGKLADIAELLLTKGTVAYIEGELKTQKWNDNGVERQRTIIRAVKLDVVKNGKEKPSSQPSYNGGYAGQPQQSQYQQQAMQPQVNQYQPQQSQYQQPPDGDIPF